MGWHFSHAPLSAGGTHACNIGFPFYFHAGFANTHGVAAGLEQQLVCHHIHSQLLIAEGVHASSASAGGGADLCAMGTSAMGMLGCN
eukprot:scaffold112664_cov18-Tisochrysis_lutea.AAC.1